MNVKWGMNKAHTTTNNISCLKLKPNKPFNFEMKVIFYFISPCKIIFLDLNPIERLVLYQPNSTFFWF
jgi:hypothetical protein